MSLERRVRSTVKRACKHAILDMERKCGPAAANMYREALAAVQDEMEAEAARCNVCGLLSIRNRVEREVFLRIMEMKG